MSRLIEYTNEVTPSVFGDLRPDTSGDTLVRTAGMPITCTPVAVVWVAVRVVALAVAAVVATATGSREVE